MVSGVPLIPKIKMAILAWLAVNVPRFSKSSVADCGKYLGVWLGRNLIKNTVQAPLEKFQNRVTELVEAHTPGSVGIFRYNEYVASVFAYVAQFIFPDFPSDLERLEHQSILKILRMPGNALSRRLALSLREFLGVEPKPLIHSFLAVMPRYAMSEQTHLIELAKHITVLLGDERNLRESGRICPTGGLDSVPIVQRLFDSMCGLGPHKVAAAAWAREQPSTDFLGSGRVVALRSCSLLLPIPDPKKNVQTDLMKALSAELHHVDFNVLYANKARVTFGDTFASQVLLSSKWFDELRPFLQLVKPFVRVCGLKTIAGAWCTSFRFRHLAGSCTLPCIFGCQQSDDCLAHYIFCPVLWNLIGQHFGTEDDYRFHSRVCLSAPTEVKLRRLALAHFIYSQLSSCPDCQHFLNAHVASPGMYHTWREIHQLAVGIGRAGFHVVW